MVIDIDHFNKQIEGINTEIYNLNKTLKYRKNSKLDTLTPSEVNKKYDLWINNFPHVVIPTQNHLIIEHQAIEVNYLNSEFMDVESSFSTETLDLIYEWRKEDMNLEIDSSILNDLVYDLIHTYIYDYGEILKSIKECYLFVGIENETTILKNIIELYKTVINNPNLQVHIFHSMRVPKKISDMIIKILIEIFENRINLLNPELTIQTGKTIVVTKSKNLEKITWLGQQNQLVELIIELVSKGWISEPDFMNLRSYAEAITELFDISGTARNKNSDYVNSFYQVLKPVRHERDGKVYKFQEQNNYKLNFSEIKQNKS